MATPTPAVRFSDVPENLPRSFALETYWNQRIDTSEGDLVAVPLKKDDKGVILTNPQARLFYFEPSKKHGGRLLHIRCGYNNKYWMAKQPDDASGDIVITATATEREEDLGKPQLCTLFAVDLKAMGKGDAQYNARFYDPRLGKQAVILGHAEEKISTASADFVNLQKKSNEFVLSDLSGQVVLPRFVAFKGDNGKYLSARQVNGSPYLQFSEDDVAASSVMFTTYHNHDGTVRLKSKSHDRFMRFDTNWIMADGGDNVRAKDTLFRVFKVGDYYGLKSMGNNQFCSRLTLDGKTSCLNAAESNMTKQARLWVAEPVLSRQIYNVVYHGIEKARVYDIKTITMATSSAINRTSQNNNVNLALTVTETQTSTWDSSVSLKTGVTTTIKAGVPAVASVDTEISFEFTSEYNWGKTEVKETQQQIAYDVIVPKMKKVTVSAIASQAKCDVPFSYTQKDVLPTGEVRVTQHKDGIYTGMNTFNLQYETKEEDLPAPE